MASNGKVALVTGGGSGIGRASALALAREGFAVVVAGRRPEPLNAVVSEIEGMQGRALGVPTDVGDPESVAALFAATKAEFGRLDVLFNNAGRGTPATPIDELSLELWQSVINTNLTGPFLCAREAIKIMKAQTPRGGRIINNGSLSAYVPRPFSAAYTATKHAITGLTKCIALDGRAHDITASQIDIGNADTEMGGKVKSPVPQATGQLAAEPVMDVEHVARAVLHIANLPLDANILNVTLMATKMPYVGRG
jgi:NAD(P)-dependent dehydrogenase (short-subunit alcohol dehydrogenase family)